jgi:hypothetical protein
LNNTSPNKTPNEEIEVKLKIFATCALIACFSQPQPVAAFDLDSGNAAVEVAIATVAPVIFTEASPSGGDATLVLRVTTMTTNAWFDATAPYHPTAVGVYTRLGRQPASESENNRAMNVALLYASYRVFNALLPGQAPVWRDMLVSLGLDPDDNSSDLNTPIGIGNVAGLGVVQGREHDGMNQLGAEGGRDFNPTPYKDYTGYKPVNTAYDLVNPSRWQPDLQRQGMGLYKIQQFVTPQFALVEPYSYLNPQRFHVQPPTDSNHKRFRAYRAQADEVLEASASLDDQRKLKAELFDNKIESLGFSAVFAALSRGLSLLDFIHLDFLTNMAAHDAGIVIWQEKRRFDAVRPFSAISWIYGDRPVTAWGGPGEGTISNLPANEWRSYLEEADHPEYPSASACFCNAHAQAARLFLGDDELGWQIPKAAGSSRVEPGITPASDAVLRFDSWSEFAADCGESRVWAGVHFPAAVRASEQLCSVFGDMAYDYLNALVAGTAPARPPSEGASVPRRGHGHGRGHDGRH